MIKLIVSGGQSGSDRGGWDAAMELNILHGGFVPKNYKAEDGTIPEKYYKNTVIETKYYGYEQRTVLNIEQSDGTVIFSKIPLSVGSALTQRTCFLKKKPYLVINYPFSDLEKIISLIREFIHINKIEALNIAGNRESISPGIQKSVKELLLKVLKDDIKQD